MLAAARTAAGFFGRGAAHRSGVRGARSIGSVTTPAYIGSNGHVDGSGERIMTPPGSNMRRPFSGEWLDRRSATIAAAGVVAPRKATSGRSHQVAPHYPPVHIGARRFAATALADSYSVEVGQACTAYVKNWDALSEARAVLYNKLVEGTDISAEDLKRGFEVAGEMLITERDLVQFIKEGEAPKYIIERLKAVVDLGKIPEEKRRVYGVEEWKTILLSNMPQKYTREDMEVIFTRPVELKAVQAKTSPHIDPRGVRTFSSAVLSPGIPGIGIDDFARAFKKQAKTRKAYEKADAECTNYLLQLSTVGEAEFYEAEENLVAMGANPQDVRDFCLAGGDAEAAKARVHAIINMKLPSLNEDSPRIPSEVWQSFLKEIPRKLSNGSLSNLFSQATVELINLGYNKFDKIVASSFKPTEQYERICAKRMRKVSEFLQQNTGGDGNVIGVLMRSLREGCWFAKCFQNVLKENPEDLRTFWGGEAMIKPSEANEGWAKKERDEYRIGAKSHQQRVTEERQREQHCVPTL